MEKNINKNEVTLNGHVERIHFGAKNAEKGNTPVLLTVRTVENFDGGNRFTHTPVTVFADDAQLAAYKDAEARLGKEESVTIGLVGSLTSHSQYGTGVIAKPEDVQMGIKLKSEKKNDVGNRVVLDGTIERVIAKSEGFVKVTVLTEQEDRKAYLAFNINEKRTPEAFKAIMDNIAEDADGKPVLKEGAKMEISLQGQLHNNNYNKGEEKRYEMVVDANKAEVKLAQKQEKKAEVKAKAAPKKAPKAKKTAGPKLG